MHSFEDDGKEPMKSYIALAFPEGQLLASFLFLEDQGCPAGPGSGGL